jgi:transposase
VSDEKIDKWVRVTGTDRETLKERVTTMYVGQQMSIRKISEETGRSYGAVHRLLCDAQVEFRPRGNHRATR